MTDREKIAYAEGLDNEALITVLNPRKNGLYDLSGRPFIHTEVFFPDASGKFWFSFRGGSKVIVTLTAWEYYDLIRKWAWKGRYGTLGASSFFQNADHLIYNLPQGQDKIRMADIAEGD